jgi:hypothetical protein
MRTGGKVWNENATVTPCPVRTSEIRVLLRPELRTWVLGAIEWAGGRNAAGAERRELPQYAGDRVHHSLPGERMCTDWRCNTATGGVGRRTENVA